MNFWRSIFCFCVVILSLASSPAGTIVRFSTSVGNFDTELYDDTKPNTVRNFLNYVQSQRYANMFMHRVVTNFVVQGGGFYVVNRGTANATYYNVRTDSPVANEFNVGAHYSNVYGTMAMAKTSDPDSANSQFFFNLADNSSSLDDPNNSGGFTVFGHIISGTNALNNFLVGPSNNVVKEINRGGYLTELPVLASTDTNNFNYEDVIYVDVRTVSYQAAYNGLFTAGQGAQAVPGTLTLTCKANQKFTGSVRLGAAKYAFTGQFGAGGTATATAVSSSAGSLAISLGPDPLFGMDRLAGTVTGNGWVADLSADRSYFDAKTNQATRFVGSYTMVIPGTNVPGGAGDGFASITIDKSGKVKVTGYLADGTAFTQTSPLSQYGRCPLYANFLGGRGAVSGWLSFVGPTGDTITGSVLWQKPAAGKILSSGITAQSTAIGGRYTKPLVGYPVLNLADTSLTFSGASLAVPVTNSVTLGANNKIANHGPANATLTLTLPTGLFKGTVKLPGSLTTFQMKGAVVQNQTNASGFFLTPDQSGRVVLGQ
jgi:cyclophilin family peptidyl-prolyl cis-trans isomerase